MIITLAGASGSGKTTLAKALAEHFGWEFKENSAGLIINAQHKEYMAAHWGYNGNAGQVEVINKSHRDPTFGLYFQQSIVEARRRLMMSTATNHINAVYDRGPLDPIVFYLNQVVHNFSEQVAESFFESCIPGLREVNLVIRVPLQNPECVIENNDSRVANWYFQQKIDNLYDQAARIVDHLSYVHSELFMGHKIHIFRTTTWSWEQRLKECIMKIESLNT